MSTWQPEVHAPFRASDIIADNAALLATALAADVARRLKSAIADRGHASLVVSGGSTPLPFLLSLSGFDLSWRQVTVTLADERWVDSEHMDSNERFVRENFLVGPVAEAKFVSLKADADTPQEGWAEVEQRVAAIPRPFDVVVLGMGGDGHTASLFPDTEGLQQALQTDCGKLTWPMNPPSVVQARMSMTLDALLNCEMLALHIVGNEKKVMFERSLSAAPATYPIAAVIQTAPEKLTVYWSP